MNRTCQSNGMDHAQGGDVSPEIQNVYSHRLGRVIENTMLFEGGKFAQDEIPNHLSSRIQNLAGTNWTELMLSHLPLLQTLGLAFEFFAILAWRQTSVFFK